MGLWDNYYDDQIYLLYPSETSKTFSPNQKAFKSKASPLFRIHQRYASPLNGLFQPFVKMVTSSFGLMLMGDGF